MGWEYELLMAVIVHLKLTHYESQTGAMREGAVNNGLEESFSGHCWCLGSRSSVEKVKRQKCKRWRSGVKGWKKAKLHCLDICCKMYQDAEVYMSIWVSIDMYRRIWKGLGRIRRGVGTNRFRI